MSIGNLLVSTAGHFEILIDHHKSSAYLKSVEGGHMKTSVIDEPHGASHDRIKHTAIAEIEPITIDLGLSGCDDIMSWVQASWRKDFQRRSGEIVHANFDMKPVYLYSFSDALLLETTFPALDGNSKEPGFLKLKFQPEHMNEQKLPGIGPSIGNPISNPMGSKQKLWACSQFRLTIDGIPDFAFTNHIDSFTIKQGIKKMWSGIERLPQIEPTKIEVPHITGTLAAGYANALHKWHEQTTRKGAKDPSVQKHGSLEFLGPDKITPIFRIELYEVGLFGLQHQQSTGNAEAIKRAKFELYVGRMDIDGPSKYIGML